MIKFALVDDGTLDTVIKCEECGKVERYNPVFFESWDEAIPEMADDDRIESVMSDAQFTHECGVDGVPHDNG